MKHQKLFEDINSVVNEGPVQEQNYFANKNRVSKDFRHDDRIDNETKSVLKKFEALSTEQQNKFLKIVSSKTKMDPKVADDLATQ